MGTPCDHPSYPPLPTQVASNVPTACSHSLPVLPVQQGVQGLGECRQSCLLARGGSGTYSADFQKCPGWERRRLRFGSFSSMSMSLVKVGLSSCS